MKRIVLISLLSLLAIMAVAVVQAQSIDDITPILPITNDFQYEVQPSDTLDSIGALFDVSPRCLADTNSLEEPGSLSIGQQLTISVSCPNYDGLDFVDVTREPVTGDPNCDGYTVQISDTVDTIAQALDIAVGSIFAANDDLERGDLLSIGDCLTIPADAPPYGTTIANESNPDAASATAGSGGGANTYVVQQGDTLDTITAGLNLDTACIATTNIELGRIPDAGTLFPGDVLLIDDTCGPYTGFAGSSLIDTVPNSIIAPPAQLPSDDPEPESTAEAGA